MKTKNKEFILKDLISRKNEMNAIIKPKHILSSFKNLSPSEVYDCLVVLQDEAAIKLHIGDSPEYDDIYRINILPRGLAYFANKEKEFWKDFRQWSINIGGIIFSAFLGWVFSMLTLFLTGQFPPPPPPL